MIDDRVLAYAAGFIDGDGTIYLYTSKGGGFTSGIDAASQDRSVLDFLLRSFQCGKIYFLKTGLGKGCWVWRLYRRDRLSHVLRMLIPYLKLKRQQAELLLEFCERHKFNGPETCRDREIAKEISRLNNRGLTIDPSTFNHANEAKPHLGVDLTQYVEKSNLPEGC